MGSDDTTRIPGSGDRLDLQRTVPVTGSAEVSCDNPVTAQNKANRNVMDLPTARARMRGMRIFMSVLLEREIAKKTCLNAAAGDRCSPRNAVKWKREQLGLTFVI